MEFLFNFCTYRACHAPHFYVHSGVARQNKLEIPKDKDEVNKQDIHDCDGQAHDPDTMVVPLTPKPTNQAESFSRVPPTIVLSREEDTTLRKWPKTRYRSSNCILETKTKVGSTVSKDRTHVPNQISMRRR
jgi:hypothetical protein